MSDFKLTKALHVADPTRHLSFAGLVLRDAIGGRTLSASSDQEHLQATMDWLCRAQDAVEGGGLSGGYSWSLGWRHPYPETTGYTIPTFLNYAHLIGSLEFRQRARRMADWLLEIQMPSGAIGSGVGRNTDPLVFNTGQAIFGWASMYRNTSDQKYLDAARRAAGWLVSVQDPDGKWSQHTYHGIPHAYSSRVAWAVLETHALTREPDYRQAVEKHVRWVLSLVQENGWIREMAFTPNQPASTHTIVYTLRGLFECARLLDGETVSEIDQVVQRACERLLTRYECRKHDPRGMPEYLPGTFDANWQSSAGYSCLTGNAQLALLFMRLFEYGGDPRFLNAALKLIDQVKARQCLRAINPAVRGAIAGSFPAWGGYIRFGYPTWAAKFLADALMLSRAVLTRLEEAAS